MNYEDLAVGMRVKYVAHGPVGRNENPAHDLIYGIEGTVVNIFPPFYTFPLHVKFDGHESHVN